MENIKIAEEAELSEGESRTFRVVRGGRYRGGFLIRFQGKLYAYENKCRHIPVSLDYGDARFFDDSKQVLVCQTHGAVYEPASGECIQGPCVGAKLYPLDFEVNDGVVYVASETVPETLD